MASHRSPLTDAMPILMVAFVGGNQGAWRVRSVSSVVGTPLPTVEQLEVLEGAGTDPPSAAWILRGVVGHERYVERREHDELAARSPRLGRPETTRAALIPIRKSEAWWTLPQDERRAIFEERSRHIATGLEYLPAVARRLHHSRDLGEPFDFLTWFEFAPSDEARFDELVAMLRATEEWAYVDREIDIRLER
jgi:chlorite dismutase